MCGSSEIFFTELAAVATQDYLPHRCAHLPNATWRRLQSGASRAAPLPDVNSSIDPELPVSTEAVKWIGPVSSNV